MPFDFMKIMTKSCLVFGCFEGFVVVIPKMILIAIMVIVIKITLTITIVIIVVVVDQVIRDQNYLIMLNLNWKRADSLVI